jgi:hypothetical protein
LRRQRAGAHRDEMHYTSPCGRGEGETGAKAYCGFGVEPGASGRAGAAAGGFAGALGGGLAGALCAVGSGCGLPESVLR